jgi:hypothetical protein
MVQGQLLFMDILWSIMNARPIIVRVIMPQYGYDSEGKLGFLRILDISKIKIDPI